MTAPPRCRPAHHMPRTGAEGGKLFTLNSGLTRVREGDVSQILPDGTRQAWKGRDSNLRKTRP